MKDSFKEKLYKFEVPKKDVAVMTANAIRQEENYTGKKIDISQIKEDTINHILLNYIRHQTVQNYHKNAVKLAHSQNASEEEYFYWFKAVNDSIGKTYPFLKKVIGQQISNKRNRIFGAKNKQKKEPLEDDNK